MSTLELIAGGILAGLLSTTLYEVVRYLRDSYYLHYKPLESYFNLPDETIVYPSADIAMMFYMRNRTERFLPVAIGISGIDPHRRQLTTESQPIIWLGRRDRFGTQEITLGPGEGGNFIFMCKIGPPGEYKPKVELTAQVAFKAKPKNFAVLSPEYKINRIEARPADSASSP